jgi:predicted phage-related endonuclease
MKIYEDIIQGSPEWLALRLGKFTASTFSDLFMKETTAGFNDAINKVVFERLTGESPESFVNEYMRRGSELEPIAREAYEMQTFNKVKQVGFVELTEFIGSSPDGLVGEDGLLEIKIPKFSTLIDYKLTGNIPSNYMWQMQGNLWITEREWCDFFVWHPKMEPLLKRVYRDNMKIGELKLKVGNCIELVKERLEKLQ